MGGLDYSSETIRNRNFFLFILLGSHALKDFCLVRYIPYLLRNCLFSISYWWKKFLFLINLRYTWLPPWVGMSAKSKETRFYLAFTDLGSYVTSFKKKNLEILKIVYEFLQIWRPQAWHPINDWFSRFFLILWFFKSMASYRLSADIRLWKINYNWLESGIIPLISLFLHFSPELNRNEKWKWSSEKVNSVYMLGIWSPIQESEHKLCDLWGQILGSLSCVINAHCTWTRYIFLNTFF